MNKESKIKRRGGWKLSAETRKKMSKAKKGIIPKHLDALHKMPRTAEWRKKTSESEKGKKVSMSSRIKMSKSHIVKKADEASLRGRLHFRLWRGKVTKRDKFKCQRCGVVEKNIHTHHILPWRLFPQFKYNVSNGICFCVSCHTSVHHELKNV